MRKLAKNRKTILKNILIKLREDFTKRIADEMGNKQNELSEDRNQAPLDSGDLSMLDFQQSIENTLLSRETDILDRIENALTRLKQGSYGSCQICGKEISVARLQAMPFVENCINCQGKKETRTSQAA